MNFTFSWNEWFMIISSMVAFFSFLLIRKHFCPIITIIIWVFNIAYLETIDYFLAATPFKLYYFGDGPEYEPSTTLIHLFLYPSFTVIFLYFYDKWKIKGVKFILYLTIWTVFSVFYEWLCVVNHVIVYTGWKLYYSIPTYPISSLIIIMLFHFVKKVLHEQAITY